MDSLVSSNCRAASKATTGSSPANWAVKGEKQECNEVWLYLVISPPVSEANEELRNLKNGFQSILTNYGTSHSENILFNLTQNTVSC